MSVTENSVREREARWPTRENTGSRRTGKRQSCSWTGREWCGGKSGTARRNQRKVRAGIEPGTGRGSRWLSGSQSLVKELEQEQFGGGEP